MLASLYHQQKQYDKELSLLNTPIKDRDSIPQLINCLGALGRKEEALQLAKEAISIFSYYDYEDEIVEYVVSSFSSLNSLLEFFYSLDHKSSAMANIIEKKIRSNGDQEILSEFLAYKYSCTYDGKDAVSLYREIKEICKDDSARILSEIKKNPQSDKDLFILIEERELKLVAKVLANYSYGGPFSYLTLDEIAICLEKEYPGEVAEYYLRKAESRIESRKSTLYEGAVASIMEAKRIAGEYGIGEIVDNRVSDIKRMHSRKSSLMFLINSEGL